MRKLIAGKALVFLLSMLLSGIASATLYTVSGHISGPGAGVIGAVVNIMPAGSTTIELSTTTDALGNYYLVGVADGTWDIEAIPPAGLPYRTTRANGVFVNSPLVRDIQLAANFSVAGTVRGNGVGLSGAVVKLYASGQGSAGGATPVTSGTSNVSGNYSLPVVANGTYAIEVTAPAGSGYALYRATGVPVTDSGTARNFTLSNVQGQVIDGDTGEGIAGAQLQVCVLAGCASGIIDLLLADATGNYVLANPPTGFLLFNIVASGFQALSQNVGVDGTNLQKNFTLYRFRGITGQVMAGAPLASARVELFAPGAITPTATVTTNFAGVYSFATPGAGTYDIVVTPPIGSPYKVATQADVPYQADTTVTRDFTLSTTGYSLSGRVTGNGAAVVGALVKVMAGGVTVGTSITDAGGAYSVAGVSGSSHVVLVTPPAESPFAVRVVQDVVAGGARGNVSLTIMLSDNAVELDGVVLNQVTAGAVAGALVEICADLACSGASPVVLVSGTSDADGIVRLKQLPAAGVGLRASRSGYRTKIQAITVFGPVFPYSIMLDPEFGVGGKVSGDGAPMPSSTVSVYEGGTTKLKYSTTTNGTGDFSLNTMLSGVYDMVVTPPPGSQFFSQTLPGLVIEENSLTRDVALSGVAAGAARHSVKGKVTKPGPAALAGATVRLYTPGNSGSQSVLPAASAVTDASGNYSLPVVPYGTYELQVQAPPGNSYGNVLIAGIVVGSTGVTRDVALTAAPANVSGQVTDTATGAVIPGATVEVCVRASGACGSVVAQGITDASGNYLLNQVAAGDWALRVSKQGFATSTVLFTLSGSNVVRQFTLGTVQAVSGTIFGGTVKIPGATVKLFAAGTTTLKHSVVSDALGRYSLAAVLSGTYDLVVVPPAGAAFLETKIRSVVVLNAALLRDIVLLDAPVLLTGIIRGADGQPLANAIVEICPLIVLHECPTPTTQVITDAFGRYSIGCAAGEWFVRVRKTGLLTQFWPLAVSGSGNLELEQDFDLPEVHRVYGKITGGSSALPGAVVELFAAGESEPKATATTASGGTYQFNDLDDGIYDLVVTPPAGSPYLRSVVRGVHVDGADQAQDVALVLLASSGSATLRGQVLDDSGNPLAGVTVAAWDGDITYAVATTVTDADGDYSLRLPSDTYRIDVHGFGFNFVGQVPSLAVSGTTDRDIIVPMVNISGNARNASGQAVAGTTLQFSLMTTGRRIDRTVTPDASGNYSVRIPAGVNRVVVQPPAASGYGKAVANYSPALTTNATKNFTLALASGVSGVARDLAGRALPGIGVFIRDSISGVVLAETTTDASGNYATKVAPATVVIGVTGVGFSIGTLVSGVVIPPAGLAKDIVVPLVTVSGTVRNAGGNAVAGALVTSHTLSLGYYNIVSAVTDSQGRYRMRALAGSLDFEVRPPAASAATLGLTFFPASNVTADVTRDLTIKSLVNLQGKLTDQHGTALPGVFVTVTRGSNIVATALTAADGGYAVRVVNDSYAMGVNGPRYSVANVATVTVSGNTTKNLQLPLYTLSGKATDINGVGIPGVVITFSNGTWHGALAATVVSGLNGSYSLRLPSFTLQTFLRPVLLSGFRSLDGPIITLTSDRHQTFILMRPDERAPKIISPPRATGVTQASAVIVWQTDEPTTSTVVVGGVTYGVPGYRSNHSVAVTGLAAGTAYTANVSVEDRAGNGPATASVAFTTPVAADTKAPVLLSGPAVTGISHDAATVRWTTDEAATTRLFHGSTAPTTEIVVAGLRDTHEVALTGLAADTAYTLKVLASDSAGNGPTESAQVAFRTLPAPDVKAPVIIAGPVITNVSDTRVTIAWTTDEPSTSGVSLNDGEAFEAVRDENLSTDHVVTVTGLQPSTAYTYTVSSTDGAGNGPTLGAPATFSTLSTPDTQAPVFVEAVRVVGITHQSAVVLWRTDETANSTVEFGLAAGSLDHSASDAKLQTQHTVQLTGLAADTEYFLRARSVDADGNVSVSTVASFRTNAHPDTGAPTFTSAPTVLGATDTTVTIGWETDEPADYVVTWGIGAIDEFSQAGNGRSQKQRVTLANLQPGAAYAFAVTVSDASGNATRYESRPEAVGAVTAPTGDSLFAFAQTVFGIDEAQAALGGIGGFLAGLLGDTTAPAFITPPTASWVSSDRALLGWVSNEPVSVQVSYGLQSSADRHLIGVLDPAMLHAVVLTGLQPGGIYAFEVRLRDVAGNETVTTGSFAATTLADLLAPVLSTVSVSDRAAGVAVVNLVTDEPVMHEVRFGTASGALTRSVHSLAYDRLQGLVLTGLVSGTAYYYQVISVDVAGNRTASAIRSFVAGAAGSIGGADGILNLVLKLAGDVVQQITVGAQDFVVSLDEAELPKPLESYVLRWYIDGVHVPALDGLLEAEFPAELLAVGTHSVRAELTDTTVPQLTTLRVSQVVTVKPVATSVTPDLSAFENVVISITQNGVEITSAPEGAENILLRVTGYNPQPGANHTFRWYLDGVHYPEYDNQLEGVAALNPLTRGKHTIRLEMTDNAAPTLVTARNSKFVVVTPGDGGSAGAWMLLALSALFLRRVRIAGGARQTRGTGR